MGPEISTATSREKAALLNCFSCQKLMYSIIIFIFMVSFGFVAFQGDQHTYMAYTLARFDNSLFQADYNVPTMAVGFTTQFFGDILFIMLMKLGFHWTHINGLLYLFFLFIFSAGIVHTVYAITEEYQLCISFFFAVCIQKLLIGQAFGSNSIWLNAYYNQTPAIAISIWGLYCALKPTPHWTLAALVIALAGLFHIQVAIYAYAVVFVLLVFYVIRNHKHKLLLTTLPVILVAVFSFILVSVNVDFKLTNTEFNNIYALLRHPHHLVPSTWDIEGMIQFIYYALICIPFGLLCANKNNRLSFIYNLLLPTLTLYLFALIAVTINYMFVEILPWSLIAKVYPERFFAMLRLWLIIYLCYCIYMLLKQKHYMHTVFLIMIIFLDYKKISLALAIISVVMLIQTFFEGRYFKSLSCKCISESIFLLCCILMLFSRPENWYNMTLLTWLQMFLFVCCLIISSSPFQLMMSDNKTLLVCFLFFISLFTAMLPRYTIITKDHRLGLRSFSQALSVPHANKSFDIFCKQVQREMPKDGIFLCNPASSFADSVRLFSQRTHIVSWKTVPVNDAPLLEYLKRLIDIGCVTKDKDGYHMNFNVYTKIPVNDLLRYAAKYGAEYVLLETPDDLERFTQKQQVKILVTVDHWNLAQINL